MNERVQHIMEVRNADESIRCAARVIEPDEDYPIYMAVTRSQLTAASSVGSDEVKSVEIAVPKTGASPAKRFRSSVCKLLQPSANRLYDFGQLSPCKWRAYTEKGEKL